MWARLLTRLHILWLQWDVASTEQYMRECNPDGLLNTKSLRRFEEDIAVKRVEIAILEQKLRPSIHKKA